MAKIHNGFINKNLTNTFKDTALNNVDIATTKVYKGVKPMWEQLGFENDDSDVPNEKIYWKNIIPKDYNFFNLTDTLEINNIEVDSDVGVSSGAKIPRQSYRDIIINEDNQVWDNEYLYPILPKLNKFGVFDDDVNVETSYGNSSIAPITNIDEIANNLLLDVDFDQNDTDDLIDKTEINKIEYNQDFQLTLDENLRLKIDTLIIPDGMETEESEQAF
tara:strand:+ start:188 stop:841 length:654 start_codon:yes stop_codon:yes gene_type:complete